MSLSRCLRCRAAACSSSVYLWRALWFHTMPSEAPPWLGTLTKPWHRGKWKTVTTSNLTLCPLPSARLRFLKMEPTNQKKKGKQNKSLFEVVIQCDNNKK